MATASTGTGSVRIGHHVLDLPETHKLAQILEKNPRYDFQYWNIIRAVLAENGLTGPQLIDIGANIGDSIAHFRRFSDGPVLGIEADALYFDCMQRNTAAMGDVTLRHALVAPERLKGRVSLHVDNGTGRSTLDDGAAYAGDTLSTRALITACTVPFVIKSDTDGFDGTLIGALTRQMAAQDKWAALVTFEGPRIDQMETGDHKTHVAALRTLQDHGYKVLILTNTGLPLAYVGCNFAATQWHMRSLIRAIQDGRAPCPYFDFICVAPTLGCQSFDFTRDILDRLDID